MKDNICSGLSGKGLIKLLKDFSKGCISESNEAKTEIKPLANSQKNSDNILIEMKYGKSQIK